MLRDRYDIVIVGSGAGGGVVAEIASRYISKGASVLLLEAGPYWKKEAFTQTEREMSRLYFQRGAIFNRQRTIGIAAARAVGGSTTVYTGVSFRPPEAVLQQWRSQFGLHFLTPHFVEQTLNEIENKLNVHELPREWDNDNNRLFEQGCQELGIPVKRLRINVRNCQQQGFCNLGCTSGAKQSTLEVHIPEALSRGLDLLYNAEVTALSRNEIYFTVHPAWPWTQPNRLPPGDYKVRFRVAVLAAGALHTPVLLLRSQKELGIRNPLIGRYFTLHPAYNLNAIYPTPIQNYRGFPKTFYVDAFSETEGFYLETSFYFPGVTAKNIPGFGKIHQDAMAAYNRMMSILILSHDPALPENRIRLGRNGKAIIEYRIPRSLKHALVQAIKVCAAIFYAAGCNRMLLPGSKKWVLDERDIPAIDFLIAPRWLDFVRFPLSSAHPQGGARMGADPRFSVTSPEGKVWGTDNVYVADASLFPTSVKVNPYETVMLLATHVARQAMQQLGYA